MRTSQEATSIVYDWNGRRGKFLQYSVLNISRGPYVVPREQYIRRGLMREYLLFRANDTRAMKIRNCRIAKLFKCDKTLAFDAIFFHLIAIIIWCSIYYFINQSCNHRYQLLMHLHSKSLYASLGFTSLFISCSPVKMVAPPPTMVTASKYLLIKTC